MSWREREERTDSIEVKDKFADHYQELLGEDYEKFMTCNAKYLRRAIRVNTLKADISAVQDTLTENGWELTPVPWCEEAFWIQGDRLDIGNLLEHQLGHIYIQDPASMLPPIVLQPQPGDRVLDMCASPGSKTTQAAAMMDNKGIIVANDAEGSRLAALSMNTQRLGVINACFTKRDGRFFKDFEFDKIMIDAPCSGTGTIRRSLKSISMYNPKQVEGLSRLQIQLLQAGYDALVPGGSLTYSTCTLEPLENEVVVDAFLQENPDALVEDIDLDIKREEVFKTHPKSGKQLHADITKCLRIHPYTNDTEGFFVCKITKPKNS